MLFILSEKSILRINTWQHSSDSCNKDYIGMKGGDE